MKTRIFTMTDDTSLRGKTTYHMIAEGEDEAKKISKAKWFKLLDSGKVKVLQPLYVK